MQAKTTNLLLLCAIISTGAIVGMEESIEQMITKNDLRKTCVITQEELLSKLPKPGPLYGTPYPIKQENESYDDVKIRRREWAQEEMWRSYGVCIPKEGAFLKIVAPSCTPSLIELEIEHNIFQVSFNRSLEDHDKIEIRASYRKDENTGKYPEEKLIAELLVPSKVD